MIGRSKLSEKPLSLPEALAVLEKRKKKGDLSFEQQSTFEYLKKHSKTTKINAEKLKEELDKFSFIDEKIAVKIIDLMPSNAEELKMLFATTRHTISDDVAKEVLEIVNKYKK